MNQELEFKRQTVAHIEALLKRVRDLETLEAGATYLPGGGLMEEGPDIDLVGNIIGRGGDRILLFDSGGSPVAEFAATGAGMTAALGAATSGDTVEWPSISITLAGAISIPNGVTLKGMSRERSILVYSGAATGTFNLVTVGTNAVLSDCTINATYTGNATAIRTVYINLGRAYRITVNSTKESGDGDLTSVYGTPYEVVNTVQETLVDVVSWATTKVNYECNGIFLTDLANDTGKRTIVRNLFGYAILDASVVNYYDQLRGVYLEADSNDIYIRSAEDYADYAYYSVGDNAQAYNCYGYASVHNADAAGGANAKGIQCSGVTLYNSHGYAVSEAYSISSGLVVDFSTLTSCIGHAYGNTSYLEDYETCVGISTDGQCGLYGCVGVAEDSGASASLITRGIFAGNDVLINCTGKAISNGVANDLELYATCYMSGTNFSRLAWFDPDSPDEIYPLTGERNFETIQTITGDTTLTQEHNILFADASGGNIVVTLPKAANYKRRRYSVKKIDSSAYTVTLDGNGGETIDGQATWVISNQYIWVTVVSDGSNWMIISNIHNMVTLDVDAAVILDLNGQEIGLDVQNANTVLAGPTSGVANEPTFRALTLANGDITDVDITGAGTGDIIYKPAAGDWIDYPLGIGSAIVNDGSSIKIGDIANGDYIQIDTTTGEVQLTGEATAWEDLRVEPNVRQAAGAGVPAFEKYFDDAAGTSKGVYLYSFTDESVAGNEKEVFFTMQMPHAWKVGSDIGFHVHFVPAATVNSSDIIWGLEYTWKGIGEVFGDTTIIYSSTTLLPDDANITAGKHYLAEFTDIAPGTTASSLSSILIGRLFRNSSAGGDTYTNKVGLLYIDAHYQVDSFGSFDEYTKEIIISDSDGDTLLDSDGVELTE